MPFAIFWGCKTGYYQRGYKMATSAVIRELGIKAVELEFNCCGYPVRELYFEAFIQSAARNLALAGHEGLDVLTGCKCCFGNLKYADHYLRGDTAMQKVVNRQLEKEGLTWTGQVGIYHLLSVLDQETGPEMIHDRAVLPLQGTRIAAHYGCQALRPSLITEFDNPLNPTIFERLVQATGATSVYWHRRLECCGDPVRIKNPDLSIGQLKAKTDSARAAGADFICAACNNCLMQFNVHQPIAVAKGLVQEMPTLAYSQLLGLSLGLPRQALGLEDNCYDKLLPMSSAA